MRPLSTFAAITVSILLGVQQASAHDGPESPFMTTNGQADAPYGFIRFCATFAQDCAPSRRSFNRADGSPKSLAELDLVNRLVNQAIEPVTDRVQYGVTEHWTIPTNGKGDCEEYVLVKRRMLIERGWSPASLLITVVIDENGDGHAVLTARTSTGDYVLDNKNATVLLWHQKPYKFVMRQSYLNPKRWVALEPHEPGPPVISAGIPKRR